LGGKTERGISECAVMRHVPRIRTFIDFAMPELQARANKLRPVPQRPRGPWIYVLLRIGSV
jgi:hypothetical protein